jgi:hypothetical protein
MQEIIDQDHKKKRRMARVAALVGSFLVSVTIGFLLYQYLRFILFILVVLGLISLQGTATILPYRGWIYFGMPILGATIALVIGAVFLS